MGYTEYWALKDKPFEEVSSTRYFFSSDDHREALDRLMYVVNDRNMKMGLLTGEVGSGKTTTKNVFQSSLPRSDFDVIGFENSHFSYTDILYDVCRRISFRDARIQMSMDSELPDRSDRYQLMALLKQKLEALVYEEKRHLVLIFDEAQQIEGPVLDEIKNLTNLTSETENYLTIFLIGQPELRDKIRSLRQIDQRIFLRFHLNNLDYANTIRYIEHRLRVAGHENPAFFTSLGLELIFRSTGGIPREINRLCKLALNFGYAQGLKEIAKEDIEVILDDIKEHS